MNSHPLKTIAPYESPLSWSKTFTLPKKRADTSFPQHIRVINSNSWYLYGSNYVSDSLPSCLHRVVLDTALGWSQPCVGNVIIIIVAMLLSGTAHIWSWTLIFWIQVSDKAAFKRLDRTESLTLPHEAFSFPQNPESSLCKWVPSWTTQIQPLVATLPI
jgi:hypothetical protein